MKKCDIVMCTVMLIKIHQRQTVVQAMVSILHSGHTAKQVNYNVYLLYYCPKNSGLLLASKTWNMPQQCGYMVIDWQTRRNHD